MSNRDKVISLLDSIPEYKIGYVLAYVQGLAAGEEETPNAATVAAIQELESGGGERWTGSTKDLFAMLDAEDAADA